MEIFICELIQFFHTFLYTWVIRGSLMSRARILMQKHIFSMWAESKDASKSEEFSMKGVSMQKL